MPQIGFTVAPLEDSGEVVPPVRRSSRPHGDPRRREEKPQTKIAYKPILASSHKRAINEKKGGSIVLNRPFVVSESLEESKKWFEREIEAQIARGGLFEDPFMSPNDASLWSGKTTARFKWLRPPEFANQPEFVADGISRFDVQQGDLGDCWLLAALASLSMHANLLKEVIPSGQSFIASRDGRPLNTMGGYSYCGMFWFRFWHFGQWVDVVVDDRLPVSRSNQLVFMHSSDRNEFWSALLEKAYAKLVGSYDALKGGSTAEAMEDFTGGMTELVDLGEKSPPNLFDMMYRSHLRCSLMACSIDADPHQVEADGPMGLIMGHAYSVTSVRTISDSKGSNIQMVRLRNPWGNDREWTGPWSDKSSEWRRIPTEERSRIGLSFDNDGEFWMAFDDFKAFFSRLELCHLSPEFEALVSKRRWEMTRHHGEWLRNSTAGGCRNYLDTFHMNPQIVIDVEDPDETDSDPTGTVVIGLMQMGMREKKQQPHTIGYAIYQFPSNISKDALLTRAFFSTHQSSSRSPMFINMREVCGRHKLPPGRYCIVPSTFAPNEEAKFMLRIFSEKAVPAGELDDKLSIGKTIDIIHPYKPMKQEDEQAIRLKAAFDAIAGESGDIESDDLRNILNRAFQKKGFNFEGFSQETCRSMVALMDIDTSGTLGFAEFSVLWNQLRLWQTIYKKTDTDGSGSLKTSDLREVLRETGIQVSNDIFKAIVCRYAYKGMISFDDFILLIVRLITVVEKFRENLNTRDQSASFHIDEFLRCVLYT